MAGGSLYWVIRGQVRVRQPVTGFRIEREENGRPYCLIEVDEIGADLVAALASVPGLALSDRGGRAAGPPSTAHDGELPPAGRLAELRALGLI